MEENGNKGDYSGNLARQSSMRAPGSLKSSSPGRSSPRNSPRRLRSTRTPRRETKPIYVIQWIRSNRVLFWLILITLWAYIGFHVQSKWAHNDHSKAEFIGYKSVSSSLNKDAKIGSDSTRPNTTSSSREELVMASSKKESEMNNFGVSLAAKGKQSSPLENASKKRNRRTATERRSRKSAGKQKGAIRENRTGELEEGVIPKRNTSYGLIVGPFGKTEDNVLGWSPDKRKGSCDRKGEFARIVWSRSIVLIFHELSMTGAPISMMELATEILSCGGTVSVVVLSKKGGLLGELNKRGIKVLKGRDELTFKAAMKADLVIAGSAVCSSWVEQYLSHFPAGSSRIVWWIMENRREYFDRSKHLLNRVKMVTFLSESQSKQWLAWCEEEHISLNSEPMLVPLSVNDELAFVAGIPCSLNTPAYSFEKMLEKRNLLRSTVRKEMGLVDNDMLVMSLSSINAGKGQRLLLESALLVAEHNISVEDLKINELVQDNELSEVASQNLTTMGNELNSGDLLLSTNQTDKAVGLSQQSTASIPTSRKKKKKRSRLNNILKLRDKARKVMQTDERKSRKLLSVIHGNPKQTLRVLIGSIGSKSNKVLYVKAMLRLLSQHPISSNLVLWTPATTRIASLYSAADVYVINAQGIGETFGRVTIEAMAFGLPVLGTDAGGTKEIVQHGVTGLLHPIGRNGIKTLAQHIQYLLDHTTVREKMGARGRMRVQKMYLKQNTYINLAKVFVKCMKIK